MLALTAAKRGYIPLLLLLFVPGILQSFHTSVDFEALHLRNLKDIVGKVLKQRPPKTILLLKRRQDLNCPLKDLNPSAIPALRLDESTVVKVQELFDTNLIALVCMSEIADSMLLTTLAKNLHRMRTERIVLWLQCDQRALKTFQDIIIRHASNYNFVNLIVVHSTLAEVNASISGYRLHPFPSPTLEQVKDIRKGHIFPVFWRDFRNKTAIAIPTLFAPTSFWSRNKKTGKEELSGYADSLILEFAKKRNISLQIYQSQGTLDEKTIRQLTFSGEVDLSMLTRMWTSEMECTASIDISKSFIVVPCKQDMSIGDVYRGLRINLLIIIGVYFLFSIVKTFLVAITCRILGRRYRFSYANLLVNLNAFRGVFGIPILMNRDRQSISMHQILMLMSVFSLVVNCFFGANLSTILTERPKKQHITNLEELKDSGMKVIFDSAYQEFTEKYLENIAKRIHDHQIVYMANRERLQMLFSLNSSDAFAVHSIIFRAFDYYQIHYRKRILCTSEGLTLVDIYPIYGILAYNSVYSQALNDFIRWSLNMGLGKYWAHKAIKKLVAYRHPPGLVEHPTPLKLSDLQWVWNSLGLCYAITLMVFIGELCVHYLQGRRIMRATSDSQI